MAAAARRCVVCNRTEPASGRFIPIGLTGTRCVCTVACYVKHARAEVAAFDAGAVTASPKREELIRQYRAYLAAREITPGPRPHESTEYCEACRRYHERPTWQPGRPCSF